MTRADIRTGIPFDEFRFAFEKAAPPFDPMPIQLLIERGGTWADVKAAVATNAPNELMVYASIDATPLLAVAGHGGLGIAAVSEVGRGLDRKVAALLRIIGVDAAEALAGR
jgi:hypothetical protein